MTTVLVAEDHSDTRDLLADILGDSGYEVLEAKDGCIALEKAVSENPDVILLDVSMPNMDGWEVLKRLRDTPATAATPVIMVTAMRPVRGELTAWRLGAKHYISKPFTSDDVLLTVKVALREVEEIVDGAHAIGTGSQNLNQILGGGIPLASLTLAEGTPTSGKSVLCQHIAYESLLDGLGVTYFASTNAVEDLVAQMGSIGMNVSEYSRNGKLRISPLREPDATEDPDCVYTPDRLMAMLAADIEELPEESEIVIVDDITALASESEDRSALRFFSSCRRLCDKGRTVIIAARPHAFDDRILSRLRDLCDAYFKLRLEKMGTRQGTLLEVVKANQVEMTTGNTISFEVRPGVGMEAMSFAKFRT